MGLICPELSLDLKGFVPETINGFLEEVSIIENVDASHRLDDFVNRLEDEFTKIQAFHREQLPLSLLLLKHAIVIVKQETSQNMSRDAYQPVLEEFIPLKKESGMEIKKADDQGDMMIEEKEDCGGDKKNWMSSVQLWNADDFPTTSAHNQIPTEKLDTHSSMGYAQGSKMLDDDDQGLHKYKAGSNGCVPMNLLYPTLSELRIVDKADVGSNGCVPGLSLEAPRTIKYPKEQQDSIPNELSSKRERIEVLNSSPPSKCNGQPSLAHPTGRKQRRCWSGELHRRFVDALTQLGGAQVATPKQIRELMGVDGLTNDEVKSHLQKYRLHTRRVPNKSSDNGIQDESSKASRSQSGSPEGPLQFPGLTSTTGGDSMEDEDDEKSESYCWKGHVHRPGIDAV